MFEHELTAALRWVEVTDRIALEHFRIDVPYERKDDGTPVTEADRAIERALRDAIATEFPDDAVLGEEEGDTGEGARRWIVDPIDGTKNFARGIPVFATLIALEDAQGLCLGMVSAPALGARWWARRGSGAYRDGEPVSVSRARDLGDADLCTGGIDWSEAGEGVDRVMRLVRRVRRHRAFGDFWGHMLVAQGSMDVMLELAPLAVWDVAACKIIVEEAGGRMTPLNGETGVRHGPHLSTNGRLHTEALDSLA